MTTKDKVIFGAVVVVITLLAGWGISYLSTGSAKPSFGAVGSLLAENYINYIRQNGGYNSADPITTTGLITAGSFSGTGASTITGSLTVGTNGTTLSQIQKGTCSLISNAFTVTASSSLSMDCAITGVVPTDVVFGQFATSTMASGPGWLINGAQASSTAGFITFTVSNLTGGNAVLPMRLASSTQYLILR